MGIGILIQNIKDPVNIIKIPVKNIKIVGDEYRVLPLLGGGITDAGGNNEYKFETLNKDINPMMIDSELLAKNPALSCKNLRIIDVVEDEKSYRIRALVL